MATPRDNPYSSFNFVVDLGFGNSDKVQGGFQEVTGLNFEVTSAEYRNGNDKVNHVRKINGIYKVGDVTLKRGLIGQTDLFTWLTAIRTGDETAIRPSITIQLQDEAHSATVMTWTLVNARPIRYNGPALNAKTGTDVAIEELVISCEDISIS
jgi:phage tail-like protein